MKDSIHCVHVHNKVTVVNGGGFASPCCDYKQDNVSISISELFNLNQALTQTLYTNVREKLLNGDRVKNCKTCWDLEDNGLVSRRVWANGLLSNFKSTLLEELEIALDFTCNMMCRSCGPSQSSKWRNTELLEKLDLSLGNLHYNNQRNFIDDYQHNFDRVLDNSDFTHLKIIRIVGGEPFYSKKLESLLDTISNESQIQNLEFFINTNASIIPSKCLLDKLLQMKHVNVDLSIDAVGELASVIRYGVEWKVIEQNVAEWVKIRDNNPNIVKLTIHGTLSLLNINAMQELIDFAESHKIYCNVALLNFPDFLSIHQLPNSIRQRWKVKSSWLDHSAINKKICTDITVVNKLDKFLSTCDILDNYSDKSFKEVNPEIYKLAEELKL